MLDWVNSLSAKVVWQVQLWVSMRRGPAVCRNGTTREQKEMDAKVLRSETEVLNPAAADLRFPTLGVMGTGH